MASIIKEIYIFGAHSRAKTLGFYLKYIDSDISILAYLIDNDEINPNDIDGVPVVFLSENLKLRTECPVYIATRGIYHDGIIKHLSMLSMNNTIQVTPQFDLEIRNNFLKKYLNDNNREFNRMQDMKLYGEKADVTISKGDISIFVAKTVFDSVVEGYALDEYRQEIQAGAELTDITICNVLDNTGDNISSKNRQFCELTAMYWIWKNSSVKIVGLEHYRRHFILPQNWEMIMEINNIDVILPTPLYVHPSLAENYRERHVESDLNYLYSYIKLNDKDCFDKLCCFLEESSLYSPCNMIIARKEVFDKMCSWLFPILFAVEEHVGTREDAYQNRYPGFLSERLISFYFEMHRDEYRVVYADKNFLS